mgnify:CR=1 FL=1
MNLIIMNINEVLQSGAPCVSIESIAGSPWLKGWLEFQIVRLNMYTTAGNSGKCDVTLMGIQIEWRANRIFYEQIRSS